MQRFLTDEKLRQLAQVVSGYEVVERAIREAMRDQLTVTCQLRIKIEHGNVTEVNPHTGQTIRKPTDVDDAKAILSRCGWLVHEEP